MTPEEINNMKYKVCCPLCDNDKCVRGTEKCEAELWKKRRMKQMTEEDKLYAEELRKRALADYERLDHAINELERQTSFLRPDGLEGSEVVRI